MMIGHGSFLPKWFVVEFASIISLFFMYSFIRWFSKCRFVLNSLPHMSQLNDYLDVCIYLMWFLRWKSLSKLILQCSHFKLLILTSCLDSSLSCHSISEVFIFSNYWIGYVQCFAIYYGMMLISKKLDIPSIIKIK